MTLSPTRRAALAAVILTFALAGCGSKSHKAADPTVGDVVVTTALGSSNQAVATPTPGSTDPLAVEASVDSSLTDINTDLSAIDSAPSDEGDPTQ